MWSKSKEIMNYFYVSVHYTRRGRNGRQSTGHAIKAKNLQDALKIATKHGIAYQFNSPLVRGRLARRLYKNHPFDKAIIERRKKGIGGSIWYEDENGKLQKEII